MSQGESREGVDRLQLYVVAVEVAWWVGECFNLWVGALGSGRRGGFIFIWGVCGCLGSINYIKRALHTISGILVSLRGRGVREKGEERTDENGSQNGIHGKCGTRDGCRRMRERPSAPMCSSQGVLMVRFTAQLDCLGLDDTYG